MILKIKIWKGKLAHAIVMFLMKSSKQKKIANYFFRMKGGDNINKRIKKKKEKQSLMEYSFELVPEYPIKKRKQVVNNQWNMYHAAGYKLKIGYKRKLQ